MQSGNFHVSFFSGHGCLGFVGRDKINEAQSFWGVYTTAAVIVDNYLISLNYMEDYSMPEQLLMKSIELWLSTLLWTSSLIPHCIGCILYPSGYMWSHMYFNKNFHCKRQNAQNNQGNDFIKLIAIESMSSMRDISKIKGKGPQVL